MKTKNSGKVLALRVPVALLPYEVISPVLHNARRPVGPRVCRMGSHGCTGARVRYGHS